MSLMLDFKQKPWILRRNSAFFWNVFIEETVLDVFMWFLVQVMISYSSKTWQQEMQFLFTWRHLQVFFKKAVKQESGTDYHVDDFE